MNTIAERYVALVLALGQHDADYVDAYYGPPAWKATATSPKKSLDAMLSMASATVGQGDLGPRPGVVTGD